MRGKAKLLLGSHTVRWRKGEVSSVVVVVLTACPVGLRGDLTRWLLEISPGVFVGNVSARVRDGLWARILAMVRNGRAIMVYSAKNEQHLAFKTFQPDWQPVDCEGVELMKKPLGTDNATILGIPPKGWSSASKYRAARKYRR
jgi:CRISPR-associated protein Cas2